METSQQSIITLTSAWYNYSAAITLHLSMLIV